jgi:hypothetical protein
MKNDNDNKIQLEELLASIKVAIEKQDNAAATTAFIELSQYVVKQYPGKSVEKIIEILKQDGGFSQTFKDINPLNMTSLLHQFASETLTRNADQYVIEGTRSFNAEGTVYTYLRDGVLIFEGLLDKKAFKDDTEATFDSTKQFIQEIDEFLKSKKLFTKEPIDSWVQKSDRVSNVVLVDGAINGFNKKIQEFLKDKKDTEISLSEFEKTFYQASDDFNDYVLKVCRNDNKISASINQEIKLVELTIKREPSRKKNESFFKQISDYTIERNSKLAEIKKTNTNSQDIWEKLSFKRMYKKVSNKTEELEKKTDNIKTELDKYLQSKNESEAKEIEKSLQNEYKELVEFGKTLPVTMKKAQLFIKELGDVIDETRSVVRDYQPGDLKTEFSKKISWGAELDTMFDDIEQYLGKKPDLKSSIVGYRCREIKNLTEELFSNDENVRDKKIVSKELKQAYDDLKNEPIIKQHRSPRIAKVLELAGLTKRVIFAGLTFGVTEWGKPESLGTSLAKSLGNLFTPQKKTRAEEKIDKLIKHIETVEYIETQKKLGKSS